MSHSTGALTGGVDPSGLPYAGPRSVYLHTQRPLQRLLEFRRRSIDDVVNSQLVKNELATYWKLQKQIRRGVEIAELERQWNEVRL